MFIDFILKNSLLILLTSCSSYLIKEANHSSSSSQKTYQDFEDYCQNPDSEYDTYIHQSSPMVEHFKQFIGTMKNISFREKTILWIISQLYYSTEVTSPTADFYFFYQDEKNPLALYQINSISPNAMPIFAALNLISKFKGNKAAQVEQIIAKFDQQFNYEYSVTNSLRNYLQTIETTITKDEDLKSLFLVNGYLPAINEKFIVHNKLKKIYASNNQINENIQIKKLIDLKACSEITDQMDGEMEKRTTHLHQFGIKDKNNIFFGTFLLTTNSKLAVPSWPFFTSQDNKKNPPLALCHLNNNTSAQLISYHPNKPYQFLKIFNLQQNQQINDDELMSLMRKPRQLYLDNPPRIIVESKLINSAQLKSLLSGSTPVYHSSSLGLINGIYKNKNKSYDFIIDPRSKLKKTCRQ